MKNSLLLVFIIINTLNFSYSQSLKKINLLPLSVVYKTQEEFSVKEIDSLIGVNKVVETENKAVRPTSNDILWIKFNVDWTKNNTEKIIELNNPFINNIALYKKTKQKDFKKIGYGGDKTHKFYERSYINRRFVFPIKNTLENTTYYLMVDNRKAIMVMPLWLWNKQEFLKTETRENIFYIGFFSFIFFVGIISLIISFITKQNIFRHYSFYVLSLWLYTFTTLGFTFQYIHPNNTDITSDTRYFTVTILIITSINFVTSFLKMKLYVKPILNILNVVQYVFLPFIILYFVDKNILYTYHIAVTYFFRISYLVVIICISIGVFKIRKKEIKRIQLFTLSVFFVLLGFLAYIGIQLDIVPHYWFSINPVILGIGLEVIVLTIAIFYILKKIIQKNNILEKEFEILEKELHFLKEEKTKENKFINLKSKAVLNISDILYIKSDGHYIEYYTINKDNPEIDRNSLNAILKILPSSFVRIHKSFIVNIYHIKIIKSTKIMLENGVWINLSRTYKQNLKEVLSK